jgi:RNA polymerase-binding transcription factor DksA
MAKKVQKKPVKKAAGKVAKATKPAAKSAAKKAPAKKKVAPKAIKKVSRNEAKKKPAKKMAPKAVKASPAPKKAAPAKPVVSKKAPVSKKPIINKVPVRIEPKTERPVEIKKEAIMSKPFIRVEKAKIPATANLKQDPRSRYSDKELVEFKDLINKKLEEATRDYELLKNTLSHKDDHGTDDTSPTFKLLEDGSDVLSKEETAHLASRQEKYIQNLKNALIRIENKTYGICRVTGKLIPKERLRSVPHATLSIDAKMEQNR